MSPGSSRPAPMVDIGVKPKADRRERAPSVFVGKAGAVVPRQRVPVCQSGRASRCRGSGGTGATDAYPTCPLTVTKSVDPPGPKEPGEIVTITIKYANTGSKAVSDLVVSDSLSGRLEYVPGSAASDRPANFTAAENEVGSVVVRWELPGMLLPGQTGMVKFKAKVR